MNFTCPSGPTVSYLCLALVPISVDYDSSDEVLLPRQSADRVGIHLAVPVFEWGTSQRYDEKELTAEEVVDHFVPPCLARLDSPTAASRAERVDRADAAVAIEGESGIDFAVADAGHVELAEVSW